MRAAHRVALTAAKAAANGHPQKNAGAAIAAAAGPRYRAIAQEQTLQLDRSLAAHPDQGGHPTQTGRAFAAIPDASIGITTVALILVVLSFRRFVDRLGIRGALGFSLLLLVTLPASWLPLALLHAITGWPDGLLTWLL